MGLTQSKPISTDPKKTGGFFLHNQYSVGRALIFRGWVGRGGGKGVSLGEVLTPQHRTEEHKKTENRTEITQNF